jgi:hypothetical protein
VVDQAKCAIANSQARHRGGSRTARQPLQREGIVSREGSLGRIVRGFWPARLRENILQQSYMAYTLVCSGFKYDYFHPRQRMPEIRELERLMSDLESDRVERKESISGPEKIRQAICAYANNLPDHRTPGYIFIGVNDAGNPVSLPITDQLLLTLSDMRSDGNILPLPYMTVEKVTLNGIPVAVVEVHPSDMPPVRLRGQLWIRVGPRRAIATRQEERVLTERQVAGSRTFDRRPCLDATLDDLLVESFRSEYLPRVVEAGVIAQNNRSVEEQLASLRFFDLRKHTPTYAWRSDTLDTEAGGC